MSKRIINTQYIRPLTHALTEAIGVRLTEEWLTKYGTLRDYGQEDAEAFCQLSVPREHEVVFLGIIKEKLGLSESDMVDTSDFNSKAYDDFCHGYLEGTPCIWRDEDSVGVDIPITEAPTNNKIAACEGHDCFHPSTEILTEDGWKPVGEVTTKDKVAALFPYPYDGHTYEVRYKVQYVNPTLVISYDYRGWFYGVQTDKVDFLVTPYHRIWTSYECDDYERDGWYRSMAMFEVRLKEMCVLAGTPGEDTVTPASAVPIAKDDYLTFGLYKGKVYGFTVPGPGLGVVMARRNGKACWIGA